MDDPYKLPLPTIPHKTMAVHGTPRSAGGVLLHAGRGSGGKNVIFSNGPNSTFECFNLL